MYGLIHQAMKDLVCTERGEDAWRAVCAAAQVESAEFEPLEPYDDAISYRLVAAASEHLGLSTHEVLRRFGDHWITFTAEYGYGEIMKMFGHDMRSCLRNLNRMHGHMGALMTQLKPPRFNVVENSDQHITVHYYSSREGLGPMVVGLLEGLARKFQEEVTIEHVVKGARSDHDEFEVVFL
jgi:hypothetical protein